MATFAEEIEAEAGGPIVGVVVAMSRHFNPYEEGARDPQPVYSWQEVRPLLDYEYDHGFGGTDCHAITAWTADKVLFVVEYDGSTWVASVPRNPITHVPAMFGG